MVAVVVAVCSTPPDSDPSRPHRDTALRTIDRLLSPGRVRAPAADTYTRQPRHPLGIPRESRTAVSGA